MHAVKHLALSEYCGIHMKNYLKLMITFQNWLNSYAKARLKTANVSKNLPSLSKHFQNLTFTK